MPKINQSDNEVLNILKKISKRVEDATIDIHEIKRDLKLTRLRLSSVERNTELVKIDVEKIKEDLEVVKQDVGELKKENKSHIEMTTEILANAVTQKEFTALSKRVSHIENAN